MSETYPVRLKSDPEKTGVAVRASWLMCDPPIACLTVAWADGSQSTERKVDLEILPKRTLKIEYR